MKTSKNSARSALRQGAFQISPVAAGCAALVWSFAGSAGAQTADAPTAAPATVVVTGIRKGIEDAISVKKNSDSIVEAISAEDIGKLPDSSIADSIARLPGLTAQRVAGRAQNISIRGLSGDFANTLLNGREQVSTGDNRGVEFDQYPSELLGSVVVYKTPDGALVGQGLSGTIDLRAVRPLDFASRVTTGNIRKERSGVGTEFKGTGNRINATYINQFADRTIGVAIGAARLSSSVTTSRQESYNTDQTIKYDPATGAINGATGDTLHLNGGFKLFNDSTASTRKGLLSVIEFKPSKDVHTTLDVYYSTFDKDVVSRGIEIQPNDSWRGSSDPMYPTLSNAVITNGKLVSGIWGNVDPLSRTIWHPTKDKLTSVGLNQEWRINDKWALEGDLSYSNGKRNEQNTEMEAGTSGLDANGNRVKLPGTVTVGNYNQITGLQYNLGDASSTRLMDPEGWGQNGYDKVTVTDDTINAGRLNFKYDLNNGTFNRVTFGVNISDRKKIKTANEYKLILKGGVNSIGDLPSGAGSVKVGGTDFNAISFDPAAAFGSSYNLVPNYYADIFLKSWTIQEKVNTFFSKADIDSTLLGMPLTGNVGLQLINTDQQSSAPQVDLSNQGVATTFVDGKKYNDLLPSANLKLGLSGDQALRLGLAKQMARPRMDQLSAGRSASVGGDQTWSGSGGNPRLDPFRAKAFDLSYEKYFGTKAYVSAAVFYKQLDSYIFSFTDTNYDFTGFPTTGNPISNTGKFTQPVNGKGGKLKGVELTASLPLNLVVSALDGFGVQASFADTNSAIKPFGDGDTRPLPGLSKQVWSLTAYYEKYGFQFRAAERHRSDFLGEIEGFGATRSFQYIKAETILDLQAGYEFSEGYLKGLSLLLQVNNASNAKYQEYKDTPDNIVNSVKYGKTYLFGGTYKF